MSGPHEIDAPSVLVVDGARFYRDALVHLLAQAPGVGPVRGVERLVKDAGAHPRHPPDVVLLNISCDECTAVLERVTSLWPGAAVIVFGGSGREDEILACIEAGATGYLGRDDSYARLLSLMRSVLGDRALVEPAMAHGLGRRVGAPDHSYGRQEPGLTAREQQVLELLEAGMSNQEIADRLRVELRTIKNHLHNIFSKLGVRRRGEAVAVLRGIPRP